MTKIYMVRHGQTSFNKKSVYSGRRNLRLAKEGIKQAKKCKKYLKDVEFDAAYSSNLYRAFLTASIIVEGRKIKVNKETMLAERDFGNYECKPVPAPNMIIRDVVEDNDRNFHGEKGWQVEKRMVKIITKIAKENENKTILIVSHGNAIMHFLWTINNKLKIRNKDGSLFIGNCSIIELTYKNNKFKINRLPHNEFLYE